MSVPINFDKLIMLPNSSLFFITLICGSHGGVFLWSPLQFNISTLKSFGNNEFDDLKRQLKIDRLLIFKGNFSLIRPHYDLFADKYTAFTPNDDLFQSSIDGITEISDIGILKKRMKDLENDQYLGVIYEDKERFKRNDKETKGIIFTSDGGAMVEAKNISISYVKSKCQIKSGSGTGTIRNLPNGISLDVETSCDDKSATLSFVFQTKPSSWSTSIVSLKFDDKNINLTSEVSISATKNQSFYCPQMITFKNTEFNVKLRAVNLKLQPDASGEKFSPPYICVAYITVPIITGLIVTITIMCVLCIGLYLLSDIKITTGCIVVREPIYKQTESFD